MNQNRLKINNSKTQFIISKSRQKTKQHWPAQDLGIYIVECCTVIKYLGANLDWSLTMSAHVNRKCRTGRLKFCLIMREASQIPHSTSLQALGTSSSVPGGALKQDLLFFWLKLM